MHTNAALVFVLVLVTLSVANPDCGNESRCLVRADTHDPQQLRLCDSAPVVHPPPGTLRQVIALLGDARVGKSEFGGCLAHSLSGASGPSWDAARPFPTDDSTSSCTNNIDIAWIQNQGELFAILDVEGASLGDAVRQRRSATLVAAIASILVVIPGRAGITHDVRQNLHNFVLNSQAISERDFPRSLVVVLNRPNVEIADPHQYTHARLTACLETDTQQACHEKQVIAAHFGDRINSVVLPEYSPGNEFEPAIAAIKSLIIAAPQQPICTSAQCLIDKVTQTLPLVNSWNVEPEDALCQLRLQQAMGEARRVLPPFQQHVEAFVADGRTPTDTMRRVLAQSQPKLSRPATECTQEAHEWLQTQVNLVVNAKCSTNDWMMQTAKTKSETAIDVIGSGRDRWRTGPWYRRRTYCRNWQQKQSRTRTIRVLNNGDHVYHDWVKGDEYRETGGEYGC